MAEVTIVTGASRGIGVPIATDLARDGGVMILAARDADGLHATAQRVADAGATPVVVPCDLTTSPGRDAVLAAADAHGGATRVIHNAGLEVAVAVVDQQAQDITRQIDLNLTAPILLTRQLLPGMITRGRGVIVMVSSMSGKSPTPYNAVYTATKHGLNGFTASLAIELDGTGVHAGVVCPSFIAETGMWSETGVTAPAAMREVSPTAVVAAVRRVLGGAGEVLVTPGPVRPLLALAALAPTLQARVLRAMGVLDALKARAEVVAARRRAPAPPHPGGSP